MKIIVQTIFVLIAGLVVAGVVKFDTLSELKGFDVDGNHITSVAEREIAHVAYVIDGDTIVLSDGRKVRYIGIDAPETGKGYDKKRECYSAEATARNRALVDGRDILLERDTSDVDRYGRLLRYVYVDDVFVNDVLVREGFAIARKYPPDTKYTNHFFVVQKSAQENGGGLWSVCTKTNK